MVCANILEVNGNTPLIELSKINRTFGTNVIVKLEKFNPGGSVKDRAASFLIEEAERREYLRPGGTIIESSSGNFAISLAMIGAVKGYRVIVIVDPKTTEINKTIMKAFGAEIIVVDEKDDTGSYHKTRILFANQLAKKIKNSFRPDQCFNVLSAVAHYRKTAREIDEQFKGDLAGIVCATSTGGQIGGISEYFKKYYLSSIKIACTDVQGSGIFGGATYSYKTPGVGLGWTPQNIRNVNNVDYVFKITDNEAYIATRVLCREEGILCGVSSGGVLLAAIKLSSLLGADRPVLALLGDSGERYVDTLFNDAWLLANDIPLNNDMNALRMLVTNLSSPQTSPNIKANYQDYLIKELKIPQTTITHLEDYMFE